MIGIAFQKPIFQCQLNTLNGVKNKGGSQKKGFEGCGLDHPALRYKGPSVLHNKLL